MLYIDYTVVYSDGTEEEMQLEWEHDDSPYPSPRSALVMKAGSSTVRVDSVSADLAELERIRETLSGIPMSRKSDVKWRGDFADFILDNFPR